MTLDYELKRRIIGQDYIQGGLEKSFPGEKLGVADKFLLTQVALNVLDECERENLPIRHYRTIVAVCTDMERQ